MIWTKVASALEGLIMAAAASPINAKPVCCSWLILPIQNGAKKLKMTETLAYGFSSESNQQELSSEYEHDMV